MTLTTYEVAELKGCSLQYIQKQVKEGKIQADLNENASNNRKEYSIPVSALDNKLQIKYYKMFRPNEELPEMLRPIKKAKSLLVEKPKKRIDEYTKSEREQIAFWSKSLKHWLSLRTSGLMKSEIDSLYIEKLRKENPNIRISKDILYRKLKAYQNNDFDGLIDKRGGWNKGASEIPKHILDAFFYFYLDERRLPISYCYELLLTWIQEFYPDDLTSLKSERSFRRHAEALPEAVKALCRYGEKALTDKYIPYIERLYDELEANDVWVADNHTFDFFTIGENGKQHRLYLTAFIDAKSGVLVGWNLTDNPSSQSTLLALRNGVLKFGLPKVIYVDNGSEFLTHDIGGRGHRTRASWNKEENPPTILETLGIEMRNALVKNAKAKPIERTFGTLKNHISRIIETFCGGTVLERPESLKYKLKHGIIPTDQEIRNQFEILINGGFNMDLYGGQERKYKGKTRIDVWNESIQNTSFRKAEEADLSMLLARTSRYQKIGRNGVYIIYSGERLHYNREDMWKYQGLKVYMRYDPANIREVRVYDAANDKYLFNCYSSNYVIDYITENPQDIADAEKARRHTEKQIKEYSKGLTESVQGEKRIDFLSLEILKDQKRLDDFKIVHPTKFIPVMSDNLKEENPDIANIQEVEFVPIDNIKMNNNAAKRKVW